MLGQLSEPCKIKQLYETGFENIPDTTGVYMVFKAK